MEKLRITANDPAVADLCQKDPTIGKLITIIGDLEIELRPNYFQSLVRSMIGQQISVAAANAIYDRLDTQMNHHITAEKLLSADDSTLRSIGLSGRKIIYLRDLAQKVENTELDLTAIETQDNSQILKKLTSIKGIGKWTAEMFLIFSLGRMNVLSLDDIGIQRGAKWLYQVDKTYRRQILVDKAALWDPHFSIASFYLWEVVHLNFEKRYPAINAIVDTPSSP
ncbi:DNA-3-methyladenine glycosylase 2 family protein [Lentibacillus sp. N15]|uniref:DNA-3-methyladenine glycosylase family protein n=1 Tax=Lentibacillus songyuanensis TaxID=3136161 RepID=UPI0031BAEBFB